MKTCTVCLQEYPATTAHFYARKSKSGLSPCCIPCYKERVRATYRKNIDSRKAYKKQYYETNRERILSEQRVPGAQEAKREKDRLSGQGLKLCGGCKEVLPHKEYYKNNSSRDGLSFECKKCCGKNNGARYHTVHKHDPEFKKARADYSHAWHLRNQERNNSRIRADHRRLRMACLEHYGGRCACCGEARYEFLAIDHINGGGGKHRKEVGTSKMERWLIRNGFPAGFRVLCHNCNQSLGHYGFCPHDKENKTRMVHAVA